MVNGNNGHGAAKNGSRFQLDRNTTINLGTALAVISLFFVQSSRSDSVQESNRQRDETVLVKIASMETTQAAHGESLKEIRRDLEGIKDRLREIEGRIK